MSNSFIQVNTQYKFPSFPLSVKLKYSRVLKASTTRRGFALGGRATLGGRGTLALGGRTTFAWFAVLVSTVDDLAS